MRTCFIAPPPRTFTAACLAILLLFATASSRADDQNAANSVPPLQATPPEKSTAVATKAAGSIRDSQGRTRYIVELVNDQTGKPAKFTDKDSFKKWHDDNAAKLIGEAIKLRGVEIFSSTSLIGVTFTAYLTEKQLDQLAKDKRVTRITPDAYLQSSAMWSDTNDGYYWWQPSQTRSWGLQAMGISGGASNGTATVYVLDTGVQSHSDLQGLSAIAALPGIHPVGCYSHASHVAGIIGAGDNGFGTVGVLPGVRLVSIALADVNDPSGACSGPGDRSASQSGLIKALEMVFWDTYWTQKVAVLNLSFNLGGGIFSRDSIIGQWMSFVATPFPSTHWLSYRGVLIVQSAGNSDTNACTQAYDGYSAGVLVVGGLDENGQRVRPLAGARNAYNVDVPDIVAEPGSNHNIPEPGLTRNDCVSLWAPSQRIKSTWGGNGYRTLSGTSMAAPHVAGFAARVLESDPAIWTSHDLAAAVRARAVPLIGSNLPMPHWHGVSQHTAPTLEISDRYGWGGRFQSSVRQINFMYPNGVFEDDLIHLRFEAEGAASCQVMWSNSTGTFSNYVWASSSQNLSAYLSPGFNSVRFTCRSSFGQQNSVEVVGYVKRNVKRVQWFARTISGGAWQAMQTGQSGFDTVFWSIAANEPFEQRYESDGADECAVTSNGITITRNAYGGPEVTEATLWDSVKSGWRLPPAYEFGTFYFGNPKTAPPPLGSFDGYRWHLTCKNSDGDSKTTMMQGRAKG